MTNSSDFLIATVDLPGMPEKKSAAQQLLAIQGQTGGWDESRHLYIIVLRTMNFATGLGSWNQLTPPTVRDWSEKHVFPWIGYSTKVVALIAQPNCDGKVHIDCAQSEIGTRQHRFRLMLQGNTSDIYFATDGGIVHAPDIAESFIMDVGHPHSMRNTCNEPAVLLAYGYPWSGKDHYDSEQVRSCLSKSNYKLPTDMAQYIVANH